MLHKTVFIMVTATVDPSQIQTLYNNPYTVEINVTALTHLCVQADNSIVACTFTTVPDPTFNAATCENVVQEVCSFCTKFDYF
jgi:hypothetical protein